MSVYDFCYLCTDDSTEVRIFDMNEEVTTEIFVGTMRDAMFEFFCSGLEVVSFDMDPQCGLILNVDTTNDIEEE